MIKRIFRKHFNCLPWFVCGLYEMLDGSVSAFYFALCWACLLVMIWRFLPIDERMWRNYR